MRQLSIPQKSHRARKRARAISLRGANHVTLKANAFVLRRHHALIKQILRDTQRRYGIKLAAFAIMGNHLHLAAKVPSRKAFANAMRFLASRIALAIARGKLWTCRIWSRPVSNRRDLRAVTDYIARNALKAGIFREAIDGFCIQVGRLVEEWKIVVAADPPREAQLALII